jgi:amino acid adenylation domain-containing protein
LAGAELTVHHLVERQARLNPSATALRQGADVWTYGQLEARAEALADRLSADGLKPGSLVAVVARQSPELVAAELAILKAGCAFVPVDPSYPRARVDFILGDCGAAAILTTRRDQNVVAGSARVILIDEPDAQTKSTATRSSSGGLPDDLMYVIYTSGSTGRPKGVMVEHHSVCALIDHFHRAFGVSDSDRSAFLSSSSFDASIVEIWPYLACGASVHIPESPHLGNAAALFEWMRAEGITTALIATALAEIGISHGFPAMPALRLLLTGGDKLKSYPREVLPFRFINAYGPTECTVISTWSELVPDPGGTRPPSIGQAVPYAFVRILDEDLEAVPIGVTGAIYIGGAGLGRGYLHRPELTSERFIQDPLAEGSRLYKTGDRACWRQGGEIAFLGRADRQVQIRGFRVEPAEIEFVLKQEPGVEDAVVAPQERVGYPARLVGFLSAPSPHDGLVAERVRARLAAALPGHMHPAVLIVLDSLPFNAHGKIDMARLPMPVSAPHGPSVVAEPNSGEATLRALWRDATGAAVVDDRDNFFDCGGDSISLTVLLQNIAAATGVQISMGVFLQNPSYGYALELLEGKAGLNLPPTVVPLAPGNRQSPLFLVAGAGGGVHWFRELVAEMRLERPVYGLESQALTPAVRAGFTIPGAAAEFLKALREVQPHGPYLLGGYSLGGLIAIEMAERLRASGEDVEKLVLLDTYAKLPPRNLLLLTFTLARNLVRMQPARRRVFLTEKMLWLRSHLWNKRRGNAEMELLDLQKRTEMLAGLDYMANGLRPCEVLIELFTAQDGTMAWNSMRDKGWLDYATAGVAVREVPGGHYSLLQTPHVRPLAAELNRNFDKHESLMNWRKRHYRAPSG